MKQYFIEIVFFSMAVTSKMHGRHFSNKLILSLVYGGNITV